MIIDTIQKISDSFYNRNTFGHCECSRGFAGDNCDIQIPS